MKQINLNTVERFKTFLNREGLTLEFEKELSNRFCDGASQKFFDTLVNSDKDRPITALLTGGFIWIFSQKGHRFWQEVEERWIISEERYIIQNN